MENSKEFKPLPNIDQVLEARGYDRPISCPEHRELVMIIKNETGLSEENARTVLELFFQEIRTAMLQGKVVDLHKLGKWFISSPKVSGNKKRVFAKFEARKTLLDRMSSKEENED